MDFDYELLQFILYLIKSYKEDNKNLKNYSVKGSAKYLLQQIIRQINIPYENIYISKKALNAWNKYICEDIKTKSYRDLIVCKKDWKNRPKFKGAERNPIFVNTNAGSKFHFNETFHDEHIIPVNDIINNLLNLQLNNNDSDLINIENILKKLCLCKILKEENIALNQTCKSNRSSDLNVDNIFNTIYKQAGIEKVYKCIDLPKKYT